MGCGRQAELVCLRQLAREGLQELETGWEVNVEAFETYPMHN